MKNLLEGAVRETYDELRAANPSYCSCALCQEDVLARALNLAHPRYTGGTTMGQALISVDLQKDQTRAELAVLVMEAMRRVAANPQHAAPRNGRASGSVRREQE